MSALYRFISMRWRDGLIVLATFFVYSPAIHGSWLWDDPLEITDNPALRTVAGLRKIWSGAADFDYFPLKSTLQWVMWHLWHANVAGYHLVNIVLHAGAALLLCRIISRLRVCAEPTRTNSAIAGRPVGYAWMAGLIFAVHPMAVESVAWISELKNVLSLVLMFAAFLYYLEFDAEKRVRSYVSALVCFSAALLCKTAVAMLPCLLLVYVWWRRGRVGRKDLWGAVPFFALSFVLGIITILFQEHRTVAKAITWDSYRGWERVAGASLALGFYAYKSLLPLHLMPTYPLWDLRMPTLIEFLPLAALATLFVLLWRTAQDRSATRSAQPWQRHVVFGLAAFFLNLVPVLGFVPMAYQSISLVADHLAYISLAAFACLIAAGFATAATAIGPRRCFGTPFAMWVHVAAAVTVILLALRARSYATMYQSPQRLWSYTLRYNPKSWVALNNIGVDDLGRREQTAALESFQKALQLQPEDFTANANVGTTLLILGRPDSAVRHFEAALKVHPTATKIHNYLGMALLHLNRNADAVDQFWLAVREKPEFGEAHANLASALCRLGRIAPAIQEYEAALARIPNSPATHCNLGYALAAAGRDREAKAQYEIALRLDPNYATAHENLGTALAKEHQIPEAAAQFREAIRLAETQPKVTPIADDALARTSSEMSVLVNSHYNLALTLGGTGHLQQAITELYTALNLDPNFLPARATLRAIGAASDAR